jgi:hypothetical protein
MSYKNNVPINIVEEILPNGELGWEAVAIAYQGKSNAEMQQDATDVKKHWMKKVCNSMKKPMGWMGENGDRILLVHPDREEDHEEDTFRICRALIRQGQFSQQVPR